MKKQRLDEIIEYERNRLREYGWHIYMYDRSKFYATDATGLCVDESKRIYIATKRQSNINIARVLGHELGHFEQWRSLPQAEYNRVMSLYLAYNNLTSGYPISDKKWIESWSCILEQEYNAEKYAYKWLKKYDLPTEGYRLGANIYNINIKITFYNFSSKMFSRGVIRKYMPVEDEWLSKKQIYAHLPSDVISRLGPKKTKKTLSNRRRLERMGYVQEREVS